jgi:hypothetical protein
MNQALYAHMNNKRKMKNKQKIIIMRKKKRNLPFKREQKLLGSMRHPFFTYQGSF